MPLATGTRLGPYEILAPIGAGGMGEVYRARDTRLDRTVAIKILPAHLSGNPQLRERFDREAKAVSSLSHPHICPLYDVGHQGGIDYLVMEHLEGETLAAPLKKGPLPTDQVLQYAVQITDALDTAHKHAVVHRDLKPGNIMLTKTGAKLLDFGLAKVRTAEAAAGMTALPTQTTPLTGEGTILGTLQYMAPEQLEGGEADARTDIFALGAVMYEMATGRKAFEGKSQASLISAIMTAEPPSISTLQSMAPPPLDHVVRSCLAKDREARWQTAHDVLLQLQWIAGHGAVSQVSAAADVALLRKRQRLGWMVAGCSLTALIVAVTMIYLRPAPPPAPTVRLFLPPPEKQTFSPVAWNGPIAVSPDSRRIAFVTIDSVLWVRSLDSVTAQALPGAAGQGPFWSPDNLSIGFFTTGGKLAKISLAGGFPQVLCDVSDARGGSWNQDGIILFSPNIFGPLYRISAQGGTPTRVTTLDTSRHEEAHLWPRFLPDGNHFLYTAVSYQPRESEIYVGSLNSPERKRVMAARSNAQYAPRTDGRPGQILYVRGSTLMAQEFDPNRVVLAGQPVVIAENVEYFGDLALANFSASQTDALIYQMNPTSNQQLVFFDRSGKRIKNVGAPGRYYGARLSPSERSVAVTRENPQTGTSDIWIIDATRDSASRFTFGPASAMYPVWSPDGSLIVFSSFQEGFGNLYQKATDGSTTEEALVKSNGLKIPLDWSHDGRFILFGNMTRTNWDISVMPVFGERKAFPLIQTEFAEFAGRFSPDGKFIAYASDESGRIEIYVRSLVERSQNPPRVIGRWQISNVGGDEPKWGRNGKELFYIAADGQLMSVDVKSTAPFEAGQPRPLFDIRAAGTPAWDQNYSVTADGSRLLLSVSAKESVSPSITVVLNWTAALKR